MEKRRFRGLYMGTDKKMSRNKQLAKIHIGIKNSGIPKEDFREVFGQITGKRQCREMNPTELANLVKYFEKQGYLEKPEKRPPTSAADKPNPRITDKQWRYICFLKRELRLDDTHFGNYLKKVCKVDNERFLDNETAKDLITGLRQWVRHEKKVREGNRKNR